jgi:hypothetical protein
MFEGHGSSHAAGAGAGVEDFLALSGGNFVSTAGCFGAFAFLGARNAKMLFAKMENAERVSPSFL